MRQFWILVGAIFTICDYVKSQDAARNLYSPRYDHLNVESILSSNRLVANYVDCLLNKKPCPPEGKDLKRILPDALRTRCSRCSPKQKENGLKIIRKLYEDYPSMYQQLRAKWDQTGEYHRQFEEYLRDEQFNVINNNNNDNNNDRPVARPTPRPAANNGVDSNGGVQSQVNTQRVPPNVRPAIVTQPTTQRVFTPRPSVATAPPQPQRPTPAARPVQNQNQIPPVTRVVPQQQQPPNNGNAPAQNTLLNQAQTQRPDRSPSIAQSNTNQNTFAPQADQPLALSSRFGDDDDDDVDQQPPAPAVSPSTSSTGSSSTSSSSSGSSSSNSNGISSRVAAEATKTTTNQNTQTTRTNTNDDGLVNVNDIRTPATTIRTRITVVGVPPNIIDNFFVSPSINTYQPQVQPIQGLFNRIGTKVINTAAFVNGMLRATVQVFVGQPQQQIQFQ